MFFANADPRVLGYLGRALSLEFSAVQQYTTQARLAASWGLAAASERLQAEATEENEHVSRIIGRMLALGVAPNASQLRPVRLGRSLHELLLRDRELELALVQLYGDATRHCARMGDHDNRMFFETLLEEERAHGAELARWIEELEAASAQVVAPERAGGRR
ncbi:ferritin-like domain-containing protein [Thioalkalivibrio paradoxus]|uniref:Bacterioferritin n=1 Tax=Thioalkalivibrio paradoxus ARh 1 TaxID=713585 RepID=W0DPX0_9GAMM|nr:ferritin-like domain-containing protein [Thioalkalivibrio paradoxus]AHE98915.1 bacterioferritin [Thioalkalivibrio paradoxus ARh 1]